MELNLVDDGLDGGVGEVAELSCSEVGDADGGCEGGGV